MVATFLQDALAEELERIFEGFLLRDPQGELSKIHIFCQGLPIPGVTEQIDIPVEQLENGLAQEITREDPYPYIIVRIDEGEITDEASAQTVNTLLLAGVYDDRYDRQGAKDILNIIAKIYERFAKMPVLGGKYTVQYPIQWTLQDEDTYPYYFGGMSIKWETAAIRREDEYA